VHPRKDVPFAVKIATFHTPWSPGPLKGQNFANFWTKFSLDLAFIIRGHGENTPYSSSELNESDIVDRQSGGEKLKYILKFYIGAHVTWYAHAQWRFSMVSWAHYVWGGISRKPLEIKTCVQSTTNRKWPIPSPMVTWPMTSRDPERSRSWP